MVQPYATPTQGVDMVADQKVVSSSLAGRANPANPTLSIQ